MCLVLYLPGRGRCHRYRLGTKSSDVGTYSRLIKFTHIPTQHTHQVRKEAELAQEVYKHALSLDPTDGTPIEV